MYTVMLKCQLLHRTKALADRCGSIWSTKDSDRTALQSKLTSLHADKPLMSNREIVHHQLAQFSDTPVLGIAPMYPFGYVADEEEIRWGVSAFSLQVRIYSITDV